MGSRRHAKPRAKLDDRSSSSSEDDRRRRKGNVKKITLDPVPAPHQFREWVQTLFVRVCSALKRSKIRTLRWIKEVETATSVDQLEFCVDKWDDLDTELADAMLSACSGTLKRELLIYQEQQTRGGLPLVGRAALFMCFGRFQLDRGQALSIDISFLFALKYYGDLEGFLAA